MSRDWFSRNRHRYPDDWPAIATAVKEAAGWKCLVCGVPHGPSPAVLTVHHIHGDVENEHAALLAACQRCHLTCQALRPVPATIEEAITRTRLRIAWRDAQTTMIGVNAIPGTGSSARPEEDR